MPWTEVRLGQHASNKHIHWSAKWRCLHPHDFSQTHATTHPHATHDIKRYCQYLLDIESVMLVAECILLLLGDGPNTVLRVPFGLLSVCQSELIEFVAELTVLSLETVVSKGYSLHFLLVLGAVNLEYYLKGQLPGQALSMVRHL